MNGRLAETSRSKTSLTRLAAQSARRPIAAVAPQYPAFGRQSRVVPGRVEPNRIVPGRVARDEASINVATSDYKTPANPIEETAIPSCAALRACPRGPKPSRREEESRRRWQSGCSFDLRRTRVGRWEREQSRSASRARAAGNLLRALGRAEESALHRSVTR